MSSLFLPGTALQDQTFGLPMSGTSKSKMWTGTSLGLRITSATPDLMVIKTCLFGIYFIKEPLGCSFVKFLCCLGEIFPYEKGYPAINLGLSHVDFTQHLP